MCTLQVSTFDRLSQKLLSAIAWTSSLARGRFPKIMVLGPNEYFLEKVSYYLRWYGRAHVYNSLLYKKLQFYSEQKIFVPLHGVGIFQNTIFKNVSYTMDIAFKQIILYEMKII